MAKRLLYLIMSMAWLTVLTSCDNDNDITGNEPLEIFYFYDAELLFETPDGETPAEGLIYDDSGKAIGLSYRCEISGSKPRNSGLRFIRSEDGKLMFKYSDYTRAGTIARIDKPVAPASNLTFRCQRLFKDNDEHRVVLFWDEEHLPKRDRYWNFSQVCSGATFDGRECRVEHTDSTNRIIVTLPRQN